MYTIQKHSSISVAEALLGMFSRVGLPDRVHSDMWPKTNPNHGQCIFSFFIWHLRGSCTDLLLPMRAKFSVLERTHAIRLSAKFRLDRYILSPSGREKPQIIFTVFGLRHFVVSLIDSNLRMLSKVHNYKSSPIQTIKIVSVLQRLHGEIGRTISEVQKRDEQTDIQTKNSTFWSTWRRVKSELHQTLHGDRGPRARSCTSKTFGGLRQFHRYEALKIWGNQTPSTYNLHNSVISSANSSKF